jgi:type I restriction enzyme M protein
MDSQTYNSIVSFIWGIADDCLRDVYVRGKYRDVILPRKEACQPPDKK